MHTSQPRLLEIVPSDSLPRFPMDDDSLPSFGAFDRDDDDDMARTLEVRPQQPTSPDVLCEIGVRPSDVSSRPVWNIRAAWPSRPAMKTVSIRQRHPQLVRFLLPVLASAFAFGITLILAFMFRGALESALRALLF